MTKRISALITLYLTLSFHAQALSEDSQVLDTICKASELQCQRGMQFIIIGGADETSAVLEVATAAAQKYEKLFGWTPSPTAIVLSSSIASEQKAALDAAGFSIHLPWLTPAEKARLKKDSVRKQVEEQAKNLPPAVRDAAMQKALEAFESADTPQDTDTINAALAHELGHLWFMAQFKQSANNSTTSHAYGGFAPDWLDETFAIMMESPALIQSRRESFYNMEANAITPLSTFLTMTHPVAKAAAELANASPSPQGETRVIVLSDKEAADFLAKSGANNAADFYSQVLVFSDFMLARSGTPKVFLSLAESLQAKQSMSDWLATKGKDFNLPPTKAELDDMWQRYQNNHRF